MLELFCSLQPKQKRGMSHSIKLVSPLLQVQCLHQDSKNLESQGFNPVGWEGHPQGHRKEKIISLGRKALKRLAKRYREDGGRALIPLNLELSLMCLL
jgi:hypothetical protein